MVRIDFEKLAEEARKQHQAHLEGVVRCEEAGKHLGKQVVIAADSHNGYNTLQCSTCGWSYEKKMSAAELMGYRRESEKRKVMVYAA